MKRLIGFSLAIILLLALAGPGWGADANYYVDSRVAVSGDGSLGSPWKLTSSINWSTINNRVHAGNMVYLNFARGATWRVDWSIGASGAPGRPITLRPYGTGPPPKFTSGLRAIRTNGKSYINISGFDVQGISVSGNSDVITLSYCIIQQCSGRAIFWTGLTGSIYNCILTGGTGLDGQPIYVENASANVTVRNCIIVGNRVNIGKVDGTWDIDYCLLAGNGYTSQKTAYDRLGAHNIIEQSPQWTKWPIGVGYFVMCQDDQDVAYASQWETALAPYGKHHTFFINSADAQTRVQRDVTAEEITILQGLVGDGMDLSNHSRIHNVYSVSSLFSVTSTNTNPTCNVDIAGNQIFLSCDEGGNRVTQSIRSGETITTLKASAAGKGWTINTTSGIQEWTPLSYLADSGGAQAVPYSPAPDKTTYRFYQPILDEQTWLRSNFRLSNTIFAYPGGNQDRSIQAWLKGVAGFSAARGYQITNYIDYLSSLNIFNTSCCNANIFKSPDGTEDSVRQRVRQVAIHAMSLGAGIVVLAHHNNANGFSSNQIAWIADELGKMGMPLITYKDYVNTILTDGHTSEDGYTYTKSYTWVPDFSLKSSSPCINAGTNVGLTTDILGNSIKGTPDIGAYEYQGVGGTGG